MVYVAALGSLRTIIRIIRDQGFARPPFFGGDNDHAVGCTRTVDGGGAGIFENLQGGDVTGIYIADIQGRDSIDDEQRRIVTKSIDATDPYLRLFSGLARADHGDPRRLPL